MHDRMSRTSVDSLMYFQVGLVRKNFTTIWATELNRFFMILVYMSSEVSSTRGLNTTECSLSIVFQLHCAFLSCCLRLDSQLQVNSHWLHLSSIRGGEITPWTWSYFMSVHHIFFSKADGCASRLNFHMDSEKCSSTAGCSSFLTNAA